MGSIKYTYIEDWDVEKHGPFPLKSQRHERCRQVRLQGDKGIFAGYCIREVREVGQEPVEKTTAPSFIQTIDGNGVKRRMKPTEEEIAEYPTIITPDTRRTLTERYRPIALVAPSKSHLNRQKSESDTISKILTKENKRLAAKAGLKARRMNGEPLTQSDLELMADLLIE